MPFGSEQKVLSKKWHHKMLWTLRGDFHIGRWIRYFYLKNALEKFKIQPAKILDAGCGKGQTSFFLEKHFPKSSVQGIDVSAAELEICRKIAGETKSRIQFSQWDLQQGPMAAQYDLIILNNVLSAIPDYEKAVQNISQSLAPGGWVITQDMNSPYIYKNYGSEPAYQGQAHMGFSLDQLKFVLDKAGIKSRYAAHALGFWGDWAHRIFDRTRNSGLLLNAFFPVSLFAAYLDSLFIVSDGAGLFIVAQKL